MNGSSCDESDWASSALRATLRRSKGSGNIFLFSVRVAGPRRGLSGDECNYRNSEPLLQWSQPRQTLAISQLVIYNSYDWVQRGNNQYFEAKPFQGDLVWQTGRGSCDDLDFWLKNPSEDPQCESVPLMRIFRGLRPHHNTQRVTSGQQVIEDLYIIQESCRSSSSELIISLR